MSFIGGEMNKQPEKKWIRHVLACTRAMVLLTGVFVYSSEGSAEVNVAQPSPVDASALKRSAGNDPSVDSRNWSASQNLYYKRNWGVEVIGVHPVSSGYMLEFRYRIVDPVKAKSLNDMESKAYIIDEVSGTRLAVPAMENVGELRTGDSPKADRTYFMIFGNPGRLVKPGGRVSVVIGNFRVEGLVVN